MTDIKKLPAMEVIVADKPAGMADPQSIYDALSDWLRHSEYDCLDAPFEVTLSGAETGDYAQMKTQIMMPIKKRCAATK
jgi:hypothetical protein